MGAIGAWHLSMVGANEEEEEEEEAKAIARTQSLGMSRLEIFKSQRGEREMV